MLRRRGIPGISAFAVVLALSSFVLAEIIPLPARFTAFAFDMMTGASAPIDVTVTRWSDPAEMEQLSSVFNESGTDALLRQLQRMPRAGSLRVGASFGIDVHFAQLAVEAGGSQRVLLITDRQMGYTELATLEPSMAYPLTVIELRLDAQGDGTGTMWPVARINYWDLATRTVVIDNYTREPVDLMAVRWHRSPTD